MSVLSPHQVALVFGLICGDHEFKSLCLFLTYYQSLNTQEKPILYFLSA